MCYIFAFDIISLIMYGKTSFYGIHKVHKWIIDVIIDNNYTDSWLHQRSWFFQNLLFFIHITDHVYLYSNKVVYTMFTKHICFLSYVLYLTFYYISKTYTRSEKSIHILYVILIIRKTHICVFKRLSYGRVIKCISQDFNNVL